MAPIETKYRKLLALLREFNKIAVAFSGGVDSTLMLYAAMKALGPDKVLPIYALSTLNSAESIAGTRATFAKNFPENILQEVEVFPLLWPEFVKNPEERCYLCKRKMYETLQVRMAEDDCRILADGTNVDDLRAGRPGLRAIREMGVRTPLVLVGLTKLEIRSLAEKVGLSNYNLPSNSCLATRIKHNTPITEKELRVVETAEQFLHAKGFYGCRVRIGDHFVIVEVQGKDMGLLVEDGNREAVQTYFQSLGLGPVVLSLAGR